MSLRKNTSNATLLTFQWSVTGQRVEDMHYCSVKTCACRKR